MSTIQSYRDLRVWQLAMDQAAEAYRLTASWPRAEMFGLTSQIRRAASSIPANIAEGFGRELPGSFTQFLRNAQGSLKEYETHLLLATRVGLLDEKAKDGLLARSDAIGRMLGALIRRVSPAPVVSTPMSRATASRPTADGSSPAPFKPVLYARKMASRPTTDDRRPTPDDEASPQ